jgi:hypothetical protein
MTNRGESEQTPAKKRKPAKKAEESRQIPANLSNREAVEMTIEILYGLGRLEKIDSATVTLCRLLADSVDANPTSYGLWRQYREAVERLRSIGDSDEQDFAAYMDFLDSEIRNPGSNP